MEPQPQIQKPKKKSRKTIIIVLIIIMILGWAGLTKAGYIENFMDIGILQPKLEFIDISGGYDNRTFDKNYHVFEKPIIYLYPTQKSDIKVQLNYQGSLIVTYPKYNQSINGWEVTAYPDGHIINLADNQEYSYLFWEGESSKPINWYLSTGFVVKGKDTREFLQQTLSKIGLTPKEYNEFIVYWYPKMKDNNYNLIHFADKQYTETAPLTITPKPDSMLRVFMVFKPLSKEIQITPQTIQSFERKGFTVVEWGGTEIK